jgi:diacylglycerol kinase
VSESGRRRCSVTRYHWMREPQATMKKSFIARLNSFACALQGMRHLVRTQPNARLHLLAAFLVCAAGTFLGLSRTEWLWITAAIVLVWGAEAFNTALELLADALHPEPHPGIGRAKDMAAAAVLIAALGAAVIGVLVFMPHLANLGR